MFWVQNNCIFCGLTSRRYGVQTSDELCLKTHNAIEYWLPNQLLSLLLSSPIDFFTFWRNQKTKRNCIIIFSEGVTELSHLNETNESHYKLSEIFCEVLPKIIKTEEIVFIFSTISVKTFHSKEKISRRRDRTYDWISRICWILDKNI